MGGQDLTSLEKEALNSEELKRVMSYFIGNKEADVSLLPTVIIPMIKGIILELLKSDDGQIRKAKVRTRTETVGAKTANPPSTVGTADAPVTVATTSDEVWKHSVSNNDQCIDPMTVHDNKTCYLSYGNGCISCDCYCHLERGYRRISYK